MLTDDSQNHVVLVNQLDQTIGLANKQQAHEYGWLHRAFSIFLFRQTLGAWETLLQQRHPSKYHCAGLWTNACCSHPPIHQPIATSASLRLKTELNISTPVQPAGQFIYHAVCPNGLIEHELDHVFISFFDKEEVSFHPQEVIATQWVGVSDLRQDINQFPEKYTPWLGSALSKAMQGLGVDVGGV